MILFKKKKTRAKTWDVGNVFVIPLKDGSYSVGHVAGREEEALDSITCAFYKTRLKNDSLSDVVPVPSQEELISVQFITPDLLKNRTWKVLGKEKVTLPKKYFPYEETRRKGWIGARVVGSGIIMHFLNAYFSLEPWDMMADPEYFEKLLLDKNLKPNDLLYKDVT